MRFAFMGAVALLALAATPATAQRGATTKVSSSWSSPATADFQTADYSTLAASAVIFNPIDSTILNTFGTETFGAVLSGSGSFENVFSFTLDADYFANSQVSTIDLAGIGVDFTSIMLDDITFIQSSVSPNTWVLDPSVSLMAGLHNITVIGEVGQAGSGSYGGNINLTAAPGAIPEPGTWGMMLLGFGAAGFAMRRGRRSREALPQLA